MAPVLLVQLRQACCHVLQRRPRGKVEDQGAHLGPQEVVGARRAERGEARVLGAGEEVQDLLGVGVVTDLGSVGGGQPTNDRCELRGPGVPLCFVERGEAVHPRPERLRCAALGDEGLGGADDLHRPGLALLARAAPRGDAVSAEDAPDGLRVLRGDGGDVEAELEAGSAPRHPHHPVTEAFGGQFLPVGGGRHCDAGIRMQVIDVQGVEESVHGGIDRRRGAPFAVQAIVERRHHLILTVDTRVDGDQRTQPVQPQHSEPGGGEGAQVAAGALHPQQLDVLAGHRISLRALRGGVPAGIVGVARIRPESVRACHQLVQRRIGHAQLHPAWVPPTRSVSICCW